MCVQIRSSYGMFIPRYYDETIAAIEDRLAKWTGLPQVNQEEIQVCSPHCLNDPGHL